MSAFRTGSGGRVDRSRTLRFTFDGEAFEGLQGDTLASALLANGVHLVGRSFKYHRPRGILTAGAEEPNALVAVRRDAARYTPNLRATQVELYDGLIAESQNRWPSLKFDFGRLNDFLSPLFPGRVLLQDLHVAALRLGGGVRTTDPRSVGPRPRADTAGSRSLRNPFRALRRTRHRQRAGGACGRARSVRVRRARDSLRRTGGVRRLVTRGPTVPHRPRRGRCLARTDDREDRRESARATSGADDRIRLFPAQRDRAQRTPHRSSCGAAGRTATRAPVAGARARSRTRDRRDRAAARFPGQRPARNHAGRRRSQLSQSLRRARRFPCRGRDGDR